MSTPHRPRSDPPPQATRQAQARASDPHASAWVSANAGSGKTFVLTRRVLRLLLAGHDPSSLLCLTFTKAAAAEMAGRVFAELAAWTRLEDAALAGVLADLADDGSGRPAASASPADLARARALFARALETPGGLKIQTIHAFCESLLHQFPLEAGVPASFSVLDDRDAGALMDAARGEVLALAAEGGEDALGEALEGLAARFADTTIARHLDAILSARHTLLRALEEAGRTDRLGRLAHLVDQHAAMLGLADGRVEAARQALEDPLRGSPNLPADYVSRLARVRPDLTSTDTNNLALAQRAHTASTAPERLAAWDELLFNKGEPRGLGKHFPRLRKDVPDLIDRLEREQQRALALQAHVGFADLMTVALAVLERFEARKTQRAALDFGDLIARTAALLTRAQAGAWVRFKIDQRIDHVLVDEAQDTSAQQWAIITALIEDFFAGQGRREPAPGGSGAPTFFAVGDDKQSIYSFQGADPRHFHQTRRTLETRARAAGARFESPVTLLLSFRSTHDVLAAVDTVFSSSRALAGVSAEAALTHQHIRREPGRVEIWPVITGDKREEPDDWLAPVDALPAPHVQLAGAIAGRIASLVAGGHAPGDILILLRTRGAMADAINKSLKAGGIAVAGTDRLMLSAHIAVEDMMALMQVVLLPEDDLALACLLVSPLIGLSDEQLERLAEHRPGLLIEALNAPARDPAVGDAARAVARWRAMADQASPFAFLCAVLGREGGRARMLARLGEDARDPLDELLRLARSEETRAGSGLASLQAFLDTLTRLRLEIKRDMEARADKVRIMTVHGSKGLEARTVFLVDTCTLPRAPSGVVETQASDGAVNAACPPLVLIGGGAGPAAYGAIQDAARQRGQEEYRRLLYVAMTRARDQLIVTGHRGSPGDLPEGCWYDLIDTALGPQARDVGDLEGLPAGAPVRVWRAQPWPQDDPPISPQPAPQPARDEDLAALRARLAGPVPPLAPTMPLRPSRARADMAVAPDRWPQHLAEERHRQTVERLHAGGDTQALRLGTLVHKLLEPARLPDVEAARITAAAIDPLIDAPLLERALAQARAVHAMDIAPTLFGPCARAEVPLRGSAVDGNGNTRRIAGSIDRLVILPGEVWAVDFKTDGQVPDPLPDLVPGLSRPDGRRRDYGAQLALYSGLLSRLFPDRRVRCALLWTAAPRLDWLAPSELAEARAELGLA